MGNILSDDARPEGGADAELAKPRRAIAITGGGPLKRGAGAPKLPANATRASPEDAAFIEVRLGPRRGGAGPPIARGGRGAGASARSATLPPRPRRARGARRAARAVARAGRGGSRPAVLPRIPARRRPPLRARPPAAARQAALGNVLLFKNLDAGIQRKIVENMWERTVPAGEILIQEGETGVAASELYVVKEGKFEVGGAWPRRRTAVARGGRAWRWRRMRCRMAVPHGGGAWARGAAWRCRMAVQHGSARLRAAWRRVAAARGSSASQLGCAGPTAQPPTRDCAPPPRPARRARRSSSGARA
jgi:hypothetical protein